MYRDRERADLLEVAAYFLKLGLTAFGGPAAHIALMHDQVVVRRKWMDDRRFLDLLGAVNLLPGPNSTEMAIYIGWLRAGWPGLILGGVCFILPAMLIVLVLAWAYVAYGSTPSASSILAGIQPVVLAIILQALWKLGRAAIRSPITPAAAMLVLILYLWTGNVVVLLAASGVGIMLWQNRRRLTGRKLMPVLFPSLAGAGIAAAPFSLSLLLLVFIKIGVTLYGGGYVLLAYLRSDLVTNLGWLSEKQILDAVAVGQVTPGPLFTTATFIGYILGGWPGALIATVGIFLPSFLFVGALGPMLARMRQSPWLGGFLDGVNAAAIGLIAGVTLQLGSSALVTPLAWALALGSALLLFRWKVNSTWLVLVGAVIGFVFSLR